MSIMTISTLATMERAMRRLAASRMKMLHYQTSSDEMAQQDDQHMKGEYYEVPIEDGT